MSEPIFTLDCQRNWAYAYFQGQVKAVTSMLAQGYVTPAWALAELQGAEVTLVAKLAALDLQAPSFDNAVAGL